MPQQANQSAPAQSGGTAPSGCSCQDLTPNSNFSCSQAVSAGWQLPGNLHAVSLNPMHAVNVLHILTLRQMARARLENAVCMQCRRATASAPSGGCAPASSASRCLHHDCHPVNDSMLSGHPQTGSCPPA